MMTQKHTATTLPVPPPVPPKTLPRPPVLPARGSTRDAPAAVSSQSTEDAFYKRFYTLDLYSVTLCELTAANDIAARRRTARLAGRPARGVARGHGANTGRGPRGHALLAGGACRVSAAAGPRRPSPPRPCESVHRYGKTQHTHARTFRSLSCHHTCARLRLAHAMHPPLELFTMESLLLICSRSTEETQSLRL